MASYRAHFFDHNGFIFNVAEFEADDDEAAKAYAARICGAASVRDTKSGAHLFDVDVDP